MRIGLLDTSVGNWGDGKFYNLQEVGLARELAAMAQEVVIYKAVDKKGLYTKSRLKDCPNTVLIQVPVKNRGTNGLWDCSVMDSTLDVIIYFSDMQLAVPRVYKWCREKQIVLYPYIGVIKSHSTGLLKKWISDRLCYRNIHIYQKCTCFIKTPYVGILLKQRGVETFKLVPVGLDNTLLRQDFADYPTENLRKKWGYRSGEKVLLFIGRMTKEKHPQEMIQLYRKIYERNSAYRLLMIGTGELLEQTKAAAVDLKDKVRFIDRIPNSDVWELYRIADCFINLNRQEIWGMVIAEAMFYGCKVVAMRAPGPEFIIEDGRSGYLSYEEDDMIQKIVEADQVADAAHDRIVSHFTWEQTASAIKNTLKLTDT